MESRKKRKSYVTTSRTRLISARIPIEVAEELDKLKRYEGFVLSDVVTRALVDYLGLRDEPKTKERRTGVSILML